MPSLQRLILARGFNITPGKMIAIHQKLVFTGQIKNSVLL
jgi:hypothetical protein